LSKVPRFYESLIKTLHPNQYPEVDQAVAEISQDPAIGVKKVGELAALYVHKFECLRQTMLIGYTKDDQLKLVYLVALGVRGNFYRDVKR